MTFSLVHHPRAALHPIPRPWSVQLLISQWCPGFDRDMTMSLAPGVLFDNLISLVLLLS